MYMKKDILEAEMRIPKKIHYCWFGNSKKPYDVIKCIESWKKYLPDYEIIEWNEENFDIDNSIDYVKEAYKCKKWAFVSDYVRIVALYKYGGIYFDTDVEVFRNFDELLKNNAFLGFESNDYVMTAVMGVSKEHHLIKDFLRDYENRHFLREDNTLDMENTNVVALTNILMKKGLMRNGRKQEIEDIVIYPQPFFSSNDIINIWNRYRKGIYAYHHCQASWYKKITEKGKRDLLKHYLIGVARNIIGTDKMRQMKKKMVKK